MSAEKKRFNLGVLIVALGGLFYCFQFAIRVAPSVMYQDLMADLQVNASSLSLLTGVFFLTYGLLQLPAGLTADRFSGRRILIAATLLVGLSTIGFALSQSIWGAIINRSLNGVAASIAFVVTAKCATKWLADHQRTLAIAIVIFAGNMTAVLSQGPLALLLEHFSWRSILVAFGSFGCLLSLCAFFFVPLHATERLGKKHSTQSPNTTIPSQIMQLFRDRKNLWICLYGILICAPGDAFAGFWAVPFLSETQGFTKAEAGLIASGFFIGSAIGAIVTEEISNRMQSRKRPIIYTSLAAILFSSLLVYASLPFMGALLCSFLLGIVANFLLLVLIVTEHNPSHITATAIGFMNCLAMLGGLVLQMAIGFLLDWFDPVTMLNGLPVHSLSGYRWVLSMVVIGYIVNFLLGCFKLPETFHKEPS